MYTVHFLLLDQGNSSPSDQFTALKQNLGDHKFKDDREAENLRCNG
jgi:hypothetical protein